MLAHFMYQVSKTSTSNEFIILGMFIAGSTNAPKTGSDHRFSERPLSIWNELSKQIWTTEEWHLCSKCAGMALSPTNRSNLFDWKPARPVWELSRVPTKTVMPKKSLKYIKGDKRKLGSHLKQLMLLLNIRFILTFKFFKNIAAGENVLFNFKIFNNFGKIRTIRNTNKSYK